MKKFFTLIGSLFLDQFVGIISGSMLVLCVASFFENSKLGYFLAFLFCFGFYAYVTYHSSFKAGFRNTHRIRKDTGYHAYLYIGALAGLITTLPLVLLLLAYVLTQNGMLAFYYMIANMYWTWPLAGIFKSHQILIMALTYVPMVLIPWIGYIAGYKNFILTEKIFEIYRKQIEEKRKNGMV